MLAGRQKKVFITVVDEFRRRERFRFVCGGPKLFHFIKLECTWKAGDRSKGKTRSESCYESFFMSGKTSGPKTIEKPWEPIAIIFLHTRLWIENQFINKYLRCGRAGVSSGRLRYTDSCFIMRMKNDIISRVITFQWRVEKYGKCSSQRIPSWKRARRSVSIVFSLTLNSLLMKSETMKPECVIFVSLSLQMDHN